MMPSTPKLNSRRMAGSSSIVQTSTRRPRSWASRTNRRVTTGTTPLYFSEAAEPGTAGRKGRRDAAREGSNNARAPQWMRRWRPFLGWLCESAKSCPDYLKQPRCVPLPRQLRRRNTASSMPERRPLISILNGVGKGLVQGFECRDLDSLGSLRKGQTAIRAEAVAGVKILQFRDILLSHGSCAIGCPVNNRVMNDDDGAPRTCVAFHDPGPPMANPSRKPSIVSSGTTLAPPRWAKLIGQPAESAASASHHPSSTARRRQSPACLPTRQKKEPAPSRIWKMLSATMGESPCCLMIALLMLEFLPASMGAVQKAEADRTPRIPGQSESGSFGFPSCAAAAARILASRTTQSAASSRSTGTSYATFPARDG